MIGFLNSLLILFFRIIVLEDGCIKEFDSPQALLSDKRSLFYSMVKYANLTGTSAANFQQ